MDRSSRGGTTCLTSCRERVLPKGHYSVEEPALAKGAHMLKWALFFFIIAVIAGIFGFTGIAAAAAAIAKILFFFFIVICAILLILGLMIGKAIT